MNYRPEIDGLRALAVLPVIFYHAGFSAFSGGFVGVDVFFVISGYLITTIILTEKEANNFSVLNFYERRARRILPALFVVMFATIIMSWIYLLPADMKAFGQSISAAAAFLANFYFYEKNNDYFGIQSEQNPTLHLWSLSVEEQYYLIFPLLLIVLWRFGKNAMLYFFIFIILISLTLAQWGSSINPSATFFLLPTRGWELLLGSMLAFLPQKENKLNSNQAINQMLSLLGIAFILFSILFFNKNTPFPSAWALLPTLGAAFIIIFTTPNTYSYKLFRNKLLVGIGLISFSAYLWHQPLFAFNRILNYREPSMLSFLGFSLLALLLAYLTWRFIEKPFRVKTLFSRSTVFSLSIIGSAGFILFGVIGHFNSGYPDRDPFYKRLASNVGLSLQCNGNYSINSTCATSTTPEVAFFGNSYTMHLIKGFQSAFPNKTFVQLTQDTCPPYINDQKTVGAKLSCSEFNKRALSTIINTPSIKEVFISSPFGELKNKKNLRSFDTTIKTLKSAHKEVIIVGPTPTDGKDFGKCFLYHKLSKDFSLCNFERQQLETQYPKTIALLKGLALANHIQFVDLTNLICDNKTCNASIGDIILFRDSGHLSVEGSHYIFKKLSHSYFNNLIQ